MSLPIPPWITAFVTAIASQIVALVPTWAPYKAVIIQGGGIVLAAAILIAEALSKPPVAAAPAPTPTPTGDVAATVKAELDARLPAVEAQIRADLERQITQAFATPAAPPA